MRAILNEVNFRINMAGEDLAIAIAQDYATGEVLMVAFMNQEALEKTLGTGRMHYFSTTRKRLWLKGETSKHYQLVKDAFIDCDGDALLFKVEQSDAACHEGYYSCFFRKVEGDRLVTTGKKVFDPKDTYG
ncbi:MAG: phosphoribosyl-AMP cyclohydrolase [Candidatus Hydrothermarchaeaceae archaeon]